VPVPAQLPADVAHFRSATTGKGPTGLVLSYRAVGIDEYTEAHLSRRRATGAGCRASNRPAGSGIDGISDVLGRRSIGAANRLQAQLRCIGERGNARLKHPARRPAETNRARPVKRPHNLRKPPGACRTLVVAYQLPDYVAGESNGNGIVATPDGKSLIIGYWYSGALYRLTLATGELRKIATPP
jgi:hypothetical protein